MRKCICGKKMYALALYLLLMVLMLSSLTGCGKKDGSRYFEIDQEIWRMDEQGEVSQIYGKSSEDYNGEATGLYDDGDSLYFYILKDREEFVSKQGLLGERTYADLMRYDKKSGEMTVLNSFVNYNEDGELNCDKCPWWTPGFVGCGDCLYCLGNASSVAESPICKISKSDGSFELLEITHNMLSSTMFTICNGKIYTFNYVSAPDESTTVNIQEYDTKTQKLQTYDITDTVSKIKDSLSDPVGGVPVTVYFGDSSIFLVERNESSPVKVYRAKLGGEPKFEEYTEFSAFYETTDYISDNAVVRYTMDETEQFEYYFLTDKKGESHKLSPGACQVSWQEYAFPSISYYPDFCLVPCDNKSSSYCLSDYEGNTVIFELPE